MGSGSLDWHMMRQGVGQGGIDVCYKTQNGVKSTHGIDKTKYNLDLCWGIVKHE